MAAASRELGSKPEVPTNIRELLDASLDAAVVLDTERKPVYWNAAYEKYSGLKPRQLAQAAEAGRCCHELFPIEVCETMCLAKRATATGRPVRMDEIRARRA